MPEDEANKIANTVGVAALRYADLAQNRTSDYVFSWEKLLAFDGNTAPYLLYALARKLLALPAVFELTLAELRPHFLCTYLYELAGLFSSFYNADKVIVEDKAVMAKRLMLCARTLRILETGLKMLAIEPLEKM